MEYQSPCEWLDFSEIAVPLRQMAGEYAELTGEWTCTPVHGGYGENLGVWRVNGLFNTGEGDRPWSMVLKGSVAAEESSSSTSFNWPAREAELYRSGTLAAIPDVAAPACYGIVDRAQETWLWLEDLTDLPRPEWTVERFASVARHLGRMNGSWLDGRPLPDHPAMSRQWLAGWTEAGADVFQQLEELRQHPGVREAILPHQVGWLNRIWQDRDQHLDFLESMPQVFSHLDAFRNNVFIRNTDGHESLVLIDWSFSGLAAPGEELVALCIASAFFIPALVPHLSQVEQAAFTSYVQGLRERNWGGDERDVWRAYRDSAELRFGPAFPRVVLAALTNDQFRATVAADLGLTPDRVAPHLSLILQWMMDSPSKS